MSPAGTIWALVLSMALTGCASRSTTFLSPQADFDLIERVAILPLENLTKEPMAGEKVRQLLLIEMLSSGAVEIVDVGEVSRAVRALGMAQPASPSTEEVKKLGAEMGVQALLAGSVQDFAQGSSGGVSSTSVALVFRLIETETGQVIWSSSISQSGAGAMARLFGVSGDSATDRARKLIHEALDTLIK